MKVIRLVAIGFIFVVAALGWMVLAGTVQYRTDTTDVSLGERVEGLWGGPQTQHAPAFSFRSDEGGGDRTLAIAGSDVSADFTLDQRRKGLLWYATYAVDFAATYRVSNADTAAGQASMDFAFPNYDGVYDGFKVVVDGAEVPVVYDDGIARATFALPAGHTAEVQTGYRTQGLDEWRYLPAPDGARVVDDFTLTMTTDFAEVDYPADAVSPTDARAEGDGASLVWTYESLVTGRPIGLIMPKPENPGPLAARISLFAPVSLLFYFAALVLLTATSGLRLHPMHYAFLAAGFFAFHLLLAYLADHIDINVAFAIASATSVALCVGYLALVLGRGRALVEIAFAQFVFLVLFSYSFFFQGFTGLAVTVGSVLTLAFFMVKTGRVDWDRVFGKQPANGPVPAPLPANA
ncbi:MAG: inner membrane CreD family protein [Coriobacteriia bacterium]|nr:inner membrane CreD family protein [Coriobacteriia bacterium]